MAAMVGSIKAGASSTSVVCQNAGPLTTWLATWKPDACHCDSVLTETTPLTPEQQQKFTDFHTKNAIALERLKSDFKGKVEILQFPAPVLRDLKKLSAEVVKEESEKTPMARKVHASFTKFQALVGPWDHVAEGAYHQFVAV